ncbi:hypothetical protein LIER_27423 [Lithospermum erythrorhizon]|uniref:Uncharacterized protein n=1 Tax=Lithospermum erythrorhizon TaxID=34254 RepID=A0AAV3RE06_LITER
MVKPRTDDVMNEGGGSYLAIEKTMKKKKKRKHPPPDPDNEASHLVASNVDPSLLVEVPIDYRVNVEGVLDQQSQLEVEQWSRNDLSLPVETSNACSMGLSARVNLPQSNGIPS